MKERVERPVGIDRGGCMCPLFAHGACVISGGTPTLRVHEPIPGVRRDLPRPDVRYRISGAKNIGLDPEAFSRQKETLQDDLVAKVYGLYQKRLRDCNAMDCDDLIGQVLTLFAEHEDLARSAADRVRYLMVDEYQDTNSNKLLPRYAPLEKT